MIFSKKRKRKNDRLHSSIAQSKKLLLGDDTPFAVKEAYNKLRTNLNYMKTQEGCQIIAVTSSIPGEGKTTTSINLAIAMGSSGKKTLLIDGDMRKPRAGAILGKESKTGLSEYLAAIYNKMPFYKTEYENLYIMPSGYNPPNPAELLSGGRMKEMMEKLTGEFDVIIIDTPPLTVVTDSVVLKDVVDGYLVAVHSASTPSKIVEDAVSILRQVDTVIYGFVLTYQMQKDNSAYGYYGYYD